MTRTPAGLTSSVTADGRKLILQTEFLPGPQPRIVTTVELKGQVVHKVEKFFPGSFDDPDSFAQAEKAVRNQHILVAKSIAAHPRDFAVETPEIEVSATDRLRMMPGVADVIELAALSASTANERQSYHLLTSEQLQAIGLLVRALAENSRLGKVKRIAGMIEKEKFLIAGAAGKTYMLRLKSDADISKVMSEMDEAGF